MQTIWKYILGQYLKVFALCVISFAIFLLVMRLKETADFASLGAPISQLFLFVVYQVPFILPIAIPLSCLISSLLLMQRLSHSHELTALRSAGISFKSMMTPILAGGLFFSFINFFIVSEVTTSSILATKQMIQDLSSFNPLLILKNSQFLKFKDIHIELPPLENEFSAKDVMIFIKEKKNHRIGLYYAAQLNVEDQQIEGQNITFITSLPSENEQNYDNLIIDYHQKTVTSVNDFVHLLKETRFRVPYDHLQLPLLLIQKNHIKNLMLEHSAGSPLHQHLIGHCNKCNYELFRRISLGIAPLTFTLLGASFGVSLGRSQSKKNLITVIVLGALAVAAFFLAKSSPEQIWIPLLMLFFPHLFIFFISIRNIDRKSRGLEG